MTKLIIFSDLHMVPEGETIIRIPARMAPILREALDAFDRSIDH
jgi:hypothetical protein